jgi:putative oxidoreductase
MIVPDSKKQEKAMTLRIGETGYSAHPALSPADRMAASTADAVVLIGRVLMAYIFLRSGLGKLMDIGAFAASMPGRSGLPPWLAYVAAPIEFFGGLALLLGLGTRYVALLMFLFVMMAALSSHRYWTFADAAQARNQNLHFDKNLAMMGGLLFLFVAGAGRFSLDHWLRRRRD